MTHYILITFDNGTELVMAYESGELAHIYAPGEVLQLQAGLAIFHGGAIHVAMREAARAVATEMLVNG
jgi:hypothetical protein